MNLTDPSLSWTSSLDGPVLSILAEYDRPLTVAEIAEKSPRGTEIGIRRVVQRLVAQGIVMGIAIGKRSGYVLNRQHVASDGVIQLAGLRRTLWTRMADQISRWQSKPTLARVFGSSARGDGDESSDIDVLFVRPATPAEYRDEHSGKKSVTDILTLAATALAPVGANQATTFKLSTFESELAKLHDDVRTWSGNSMQAVVRSTLEWQRDVRSGRETSKEILRDGITLFETSLLGTTQFGLEIHAVEE